MFITFEGIDGAGKTSQAILLNNYLKNKGITTLLTKEPSEYPIGKGVRSLLSHEMDETTVLMLIMAARREHYHIINKHLEENCMIICDRFIDSTIAYYARHSGQDLSEAITLINHLQNIVVENLAPDITFLLDLDQSIARERIKQRSQGKSLTPQITRLDSLPYDEVERIRDIYKILAECEKNRIVIIDASGVPEDTHLKIVDAMEKQESYIYYKKTTESQ